MPNVMAALPNIGGALRSTPQSLLTPTTRVPCSNATKTRNLLKFTGVPKLTNGSQPLVGQSSPTTCRGGIAVEQNFFPIVEDIVRQSCTMVPRWRIFGDFLGPAFPASHVRHISNMHSKFALRPHHVWKYGRHPISNR